MGTLLSSRPVKEHKNTLAATKTWPYLVMCAAVALLVIVPVLLRGTPCGDDSRFHFSLWLDAAEQMRHGNALPRWSQFGAWRFGEPSFLFYPPLSWILGGVLATLLPLRMVPGAYLFLVTFLAGVSMFAFGRKWAQPSSTLIMVLLYAGGEYWLSCAYQRSAYSELLALALFPLVMLAARGLPHSPRSIVSLAVLFAGVWLSNYPSGVILAYSLGIVCISLSILHKSLAPLFRGAGAIALGFSLAAFCLIPVIWERSWISLKYAHVSQADYFMLDFHKSFLNGWFELRMSILSVIVSVLLGIAFYLRWREQKNGKFDCAVGVLAVTSLFLLFPASKVFWSYAPAAQYVQFPWRWLGPLEFCWIALLIPPLEKASKAKVISLAVILVVLGAVVSGKAFWRYPGVEYVQHSCANGGVLGAREYFPSTSSYELLNSTAPTAQYFPDGASAQDDEPPRISVLRWTAEQRRLELQARQPGNVVLRLLAYPAWQVHVNGKSVKIGINPAGQIVVPVSPGVNRIELDFVRTWDRTIGGIVSIIALFIVGILARKHRTCPH